MLQRPSAKLKLPNRRLSHQTKTPTKSKPHHIPNNENDNTSNQHTFNSSQSPILRTQTQTHTPRKNHTKNKHSHTAHVSPRAHLSVPLSRPLFPLNENNNHSEDDDMDTLMSADTIDQSTSFVSSHIKNTENIQCMVRIRPLLPIESRGRVCVNVNKNNMISIACKPKEKSFTFDHVGPIHATQESIFQTVGKPITNACLSGYNGTIFAYGQTGSGKTFTILGDFEDKNSIQRGLMPRVFDYLFSQIHRHRQKMGSDRVEYLVKCSCLEIYNERIQDLLEPDRANLQVREDIKRGVIVEGLSYKICETSNDALDLILLAARNRRVSATSMNKESSRSHLMLTLLIECRITDSDSKNMETQDCANLTNNITKTPVFTRTRSKLNRSDTSKKLVRTRTSRFNLVDLAGSERQSKTNAKGDRLREAGNINKSLTVLGHVMKALVQRNVDDSNKHRHIHYRDSKLTHLLKDSLGGNSLTFMIACISPSSLNLLESLSTLQFASRAKYIKNKAQLNEDQSGSVQVLKSENLKLVNEVENLKNKLRLLRKQRGSMSSSFINGASVMEVDSINGDMDSVNGGKLKDTLEILERENYEIRRERAKLKSEISELGKVIGKKQQFVMSLKMQLKLRETESVKLRNCIEEQMCGENGCAQLRNEIIGRYEREEKERKMLLSDPSYLVEEHLRNMELQQQSEQMMDFIHRFIDDKDNKFRYDQYTKWKNTYQILVDENEELREEMRDSQNDSLKLLAVKEKMVEPKIEEYELKIKSLTGEIQETEDRHKHKTETLQQHLNTLLSNKQDLQNQNNDLQNNNAELESKIQLEQRKYEMEKQAMGDEYDKQLDNMRQGAVRALDSNNEHTMQLKMEIAQLNAKMEATEKELIQTQSQFREQTKLLQHTTNEFNDTKESLLQLTNRHKQQMQHICQLNSVISDKENDIGKLQQTITGLSLEQNANQTLLKEAQTLNQELEHKIGEKHGNINRLEAELESISQHFADLKLQCETVREEHQILNDVHSTLEYQKREIDDRMEQTLKDLDALQQKNDSLCECIEDKNNIICNLKSEVNEKMINKDETVKSLNKKTENLCKTIEEMNTEINGLKESLKGSQNEKMRKETDIEALREEMGSIDAQLSDYKSAYNELETKYSQSLQKYKELKGQFTETQHKCDSYNNALVDKNIKLQRLLEENQSLQNESEKFERQTAENIKHLQIRISELETEMSDKQEMYDRNVQSMNESKAQMIAANENEMNIKNNEITRLTNEGISISKSLHEQVQSLNNSLIANQKQSQTKLLETESEYQRKLCDSNNEINKLQKECNVLQSKYENEKCKLSEKERTLQLLQTQLSQFSTNNSDSNGNECVESQMSKVFAQFNNEQIRLNQEITEMNTENTELKSEMERINKEKTGLNEQLISVTKENNLAIESFETKKKNMCEQLEKAHEDIQLRQNRAERLIKTFEQRLELRQKQNIDYREKIDQLSLSASQKNAVIQKLNSEHLQVKDQLKRCQLTVTNAQSLNETLLNEKAEFDNKLEQRDCEIEEITTKHNKILNDLLVCNKQRESAIKTSKRMRSAEEKAYNDMLEWKRKYNNLQETSQRVRDEMSGLKSTNESLLSENSKLAGHHNSGQRINHLLSLKRECEKLKKEKKQLLQKVSVLQKSNSSSNINISNMSMVSAISNAESVHNIKEQLSQMSKSKDEMGLIIAKILSKIRNMSESKSLDMNAISNVNNVEQHLSVLGAIENIVSDRNHSIERLQREVNGLENDLSIRDEQIKFLNDKIVLTPNTKSIKHKKSISRISSLSVSNRKKNISDRKKKRALSQNDKSQRRNSNSKSTISKKRHSTDNFNFE